MFGFPAGRRGIWLRGPAVESDPPGNRAILCVWLPIHQQRPQPRGAIWLRGPAVESDPPGNRAILRVRLPIHQQRPHPRGRIYFSPPVLFAAADELLQEQKVVSLTPVFLLTIGAHTGLETFLIAYQYEETAEAPGGLSLWLDNREGEFDDLATDYPDLARGTEIQLERGLVTAEGNTLTAKLPATWVDSLQYTDQGQLVLTCLDWWGKLERYRYAVDTVFMAQTHSVIAASILGEIGLTLSGSFGYATDFIVSRYESGLFAMRRLMGQAHEVLYAGLSGQILSKQLGVETAYVYDFENGESGDHPLLGGTEIMETSAPINTVVITGGLAEEFSYTAADAAEAALVGTRRWVVYIPSLTSDAECQEVAEGYLNSFLAFNVSGTIVARPHYTLRLYDSLSVAAPPWGGPATSGRVRRYFERWNSFTRRYEQEIVIGSVPLMALAHRARVGEMTGMKRNKIRRGAGTHRNTVRRGPGVHTNTVRRGPGQKTSKPRRGSRR